MFITSSLNIYKLQLNLKTISNFLCYGDIDSWLKLIRFTELIYFFSKYYIIVRGNITGEQGMKSQLNLELQKDVVY